MVNCIAWRVRPRLVFPLGAAIAILSFLLYCFTLSTGVYPGESARTIAAVVGLDLPVWAPARPIFHLLSRALSGIVPGNFPLVLNLFSAACTALSAGLFYFLALQWLLMCSREDEAGDLIFDEESDQPVRRMESGVVRHNQRSVTAAVCGAAAAGFLFATSVPLWCMGTRLYVDPFVAMMLLAILNLTLSAVEVLNTRDVCGAFFLLMLCSLESVVFWVAMPVVALALGREILMAQRNGDDHPPLWSLATPSLLGIVLAGCALWAANSCFWGLPASGLVHGILERFGEELAGWIPHGCWVEMLVQGVVPLSLSLIFSFAFFRRRNWWMFLFQAGLLGCVVPSLFNLSFCFGRQMRLAGALAGVDTVSLLDGLVPAVVVGVVVASWMLLRDPISYRTFDEPDYEGQSDHRSLGIAGSVAAWVVLVVSLASLGWRLGVASGRSGAFADRLAEDALSRLEPGSIVFGDGVLRENMRLMALRRGMDIRFAPLVEPLGLTVVQQMEQTAALSTNMPPVARAYYGAHRDAFLSVWLLLRPELSERLVVLDGFTPVPFGGVCSRRSQGGGDVLFTGGELGWVSEIPQGLASRLSVKEHPTAAGALAMERQAIATALLELSDEIDQSGTGYLRHQKRLLCRDLARRLNDLSVACLGEDRGAAVEGFLLAQELDPENPAILLNRAALKGSASLSDAEVARLSKAIAEAERSLPRFAGRWGRLASESLFEAFAAAPGTRPTAQDALETIRARKLEQAGWQIVNLNFSEAERLARWLMDHGKKEDPKVWTCLALSLAGQKQPQGAKMWIARAIAKGFSEKDLATVQAFLDYCMGDYPQARRQLERVIKVNADAAHYIGLRARPKVLQILDEQSEELQALALLADVLFAQKRHPEVEALVLQMMWEATRRNTHPIISRVQGDLAFAKGDYTLARDHYRAVLAATPDHRRALTRLLEVDRRIGDVAQAAADARETLSRQPLSHQALCLLGYASAKSGQTPLAKDLLLLSNQITPNADAQAELARLALASDDLPRANRLLTQALALDPENDRAWADLATLRLREGKTTQAMQAINRAIAIRDDLVLHRLVKARIHLSLKQYEEAASVVFPYVATRAHEPRPVRDELESILEAIRAAK